MLPVTLGPCVQDGTIQGTTLCGKGPPAAGRTNLLHLSKLSFDPVNLFAQHQRHSLRLLLALFTNQLLLRLPTTVHQTLQVGKVLGDRAALPLGVLTQHIFG